MAWSGTDRRRAGRDRIQVVAENSEAEIAAARARAEFDRILRSLAGNIMRVSRGAGRPEEIIWQLADVLQAVQVHYDCFGSFPSTSDIQTSLRVDGGGPSVQLLDGKPGTEYAFQQIVRGSLQIAASKLLDQRSQESAGRSEMMDGIMLVQLMRELENHSS